MCVREHFFSSFFSVNMSLLILDLVPFYKFEQDLLTPHISNCLFVRALARTHIHIFQSSRCVLFLLHLPFYGRGFVVIVTRY